MKNVILIMLIIPIIILLVISFLSIRKNKVYKFREYISILIYLRGDDMIDDGASFRDLLDLWNIRNNISYKKMLFSFKPLKMEYWLTEKELELLEYKSYDDRNKIRHRK